MTDSETEYIQSSTLLAEFEKKVTAEITLRGVPIPLAELAAVTGYAEEECRMLVRRATKLRLTSDGSATLLKKHRRPIAKAAATTLGSMPRDELDEGLPVGRVGYLCIAEEFDLEGMRAHYDALGFHTKLAYDVLHVADRTQENEGYGATTKTSPRPFDLFIFAYGAVVWWGYDQRHYALVENDFVIPTSKVNKWISGRYKATIIAANFPVWCKFSPDWREVSMNPNEPDRMFTERLQYDHFYIPRDAVDVKLCISHGLGQSAKIDYMDIKVAELTHACKPLPRELKDKGSVTISERKLLQLRGEVLFFRLMLKSGSDLLDEPELFWQYPWLKPFYTLTKSFFEIAERVETLDAKLEAANQIVTMISDHFNQRHGSRLEWIVIWLVMVEVIIGLMELVLDVKPWLT